MNPLKLYYFYLTWDIYICHNRYKHYKDQVEKTKSVNRSAEMEFVAEVNDIKPGTEWERVNKLVDFNSKHSKSTKDTTRMKSIMLQLKQNGKAAA